MASTVDVVVVGAGIAGIAAAKTARAAGLDVAIIEARDRIGGRAYTDTAALGVPFDHGCYWLHSASKNPFVGIADKLGFAYRKHSFRNRRLYLRNRWATAVEKREWTAYDARNERAIESAGRAGHDVAIAAVIEHGGRWEPLFAAWVAAFSGADPDEISTLDWFNYKNTEENWPVRDGFGALVAAWAADVPVTLKCPATRIDWSGRRVRVTTPRGTIDARAAIVTVSTGVLAAQAIRFSPALPDWKHAAIAGVPMGRADKVGLAFDRNVFGMPATSGVSYVGKAPEAFGFQIRPFGREIAVCHLGGRFAGALEKEGERAMIAYARDRLAAMFGAAIKQRIVGAQAARWDSDPFIRGGYAAALPGCAPLRADLARPLGNRLFFAGEATHAVFFSTAHGAFLSGADAAKSARRMLSRRAA
jgi:monoamine oxidase